MISEVGNTEIRRIILSLIFGTFLVNLIKKRLRTENTQTYTIQCENKYFNCNQTEWW